MGNLSTNTAFPWTADDYATSEIFQQIYINFVRNGKPNGPGLPQWDTYNHNGDVPPVMLIDTNTRQVKNAKVYDRYKQIDAFIHRP